MLKCSATVTNSKEEQVLQGFNGAYLCVYCIMGVKATGSLDAANVAIETNRTESIL